MSHLRNRPRHLNEVKVKINGVKHYRWRAVDDDGEALERDMTQNRGKKTASKFLRTPLLRHGGTESIDTDRLVLDGAVVAIPGVAGNRETGRCVNNRAENSHQPFRRRERAMLRFQRMRSLQSFAALHGTIHNDFRPEGTLVARQTWKDRQTAALAEWWLA